MSEERKRFTPEEKVRVLREHLLEKVPVSEVCAKHGLAPTVFYRWQQELFEHGAAAFERRDDGPARRLEAKVEALQAKLAHKDAVIAEIMESHVALKKSLGEV